MRADRRAGGRVIAKWGGCAALGSEALLAGLVGWLAGQAGWLLVAGRLGREWIGVPAKHWYPPDHDPWQR